MAPSRRRGASKAAAAAAARRHWKVGDLVLAKVKGFPAWPATVSEPGKWGYPSDMKKVLVYFFGTQQIAFCNPADVEAFTEEKKETLLLKRHGKGSDFVRAVHEIIDSFEKSKKQDQVIIANSSDKTNGDENKSVESSAESGLQNKLLPTVGKSCQKLSNSDSGKFCTSSPVERDTAIPQMDMYEKGIPSEVPACNLSAVERGKPNAYSYRRKHVVEQEHTTQKRAPSSRRSRGSSRVDPSRFQNLVLPFTNDGKSTVNLALDTLQEGSVRKKKSVRKSPDSSERQGMDSLVAILDDSIEENGSEIVTGDSDNSLNEGSVVESDCRLLQSESVVECCDGDIELSQRLDFQTKSVVFRKKRKPNRKRVGNMAEIVAHPEESLEPKVEKGEHKLVKKKGEHQSPNDVEKQHERHCKEDGDEHLPLVKRARVRMGRPSAGEELAVLAQSEEKSFPLSHSLTGCSISSNVEDNSIDKKPFTANGNLDNASPSNKFSVCKPLPWEARIQYFGCSGEYEAALPPSKRLHRALEAMSANAAEDFEASSETPSVMKTSINGSLISTTVDVSDMDVDSKTGVQHKAEGVGADNDIGVDKLSCLKSLLMENNLKSPLEVENHDITSIISNDPDSDPTVHKNAHAFNTADDKDIRVASLDNRSIATEVVVESPRPLSSDGGEQACPASDQILVQLIPPTDDCRTEDAKVHISLGIVDYGIGSIPTLNNIGVGCGSAKIDTNLVRRGTNGRGDTSQLIENNEGDGRHEIIEEVSTVSKESITTASPTPADVPLAGVQVTHLSDSTCVSEELERHADSRLSSSLTDGLETAARLSSLQTSTCNMSTSDNSNVPEINACCSPEPPLCHEKPKQTGRWNGRSEVHAAVTSFGAIIGTLTRTKESIARATRIAIDCARFGSANKVVEILARSLESESSLHRRVDLFFLVDSITQCSRGLKGDGGVYPSAIQSVLPRLLLAAAPPGSSAQENRRQCLKVLRVWQERRILPESVLRHHIRDFESRSSSSGTFSRRPLRTERAFDDPIREMEGMMVDEYGSNSSFQLPGFCMPPMLKDEGEGSDSDGESFEAVTPEHKHDNFEVRHQTPISAVEKHRHILEEVDGELEMEDVAPNCEAEMVSTGNIIGMNGESTSKHQFEHHSLPYAPPLPNGMPPSSPPLPTSPPPLPPPPPPPPPGQPQHPPVPPLSGISGQVSNSIDSSHYMNAHNLDDNLQNSNLEQPVAPRVDQMISDISHYHAPESRDPQVQMHVQRQIRDSSNCCSFSNRPASLPSVRPGSSIQQADANVSHKAFAVRPPYPAPSDQFSYVQADQRLPTRRDVPQSYPDRFHYAANADNGSFYSGHDRMKPLSRENWRFSAPFSVPRRPDNRMSYPPPPYRSAPREPSYSNRRWGFHPQGGNHRDLMPHRPHSEGPIHVAGRAPNFWRPR